MHTHTHAHAYTMPANNAASNGAKHAVEIKRVREREIESVYVCVFVCGEWLWL